TAPNLFTPAAINGNGNGESGGAERLPFAMKATIREFIVDYDPPTISQPVVYQFLFETYHDHIAHRDQQQVKGQIANVLSKLADGDDAILDVVRQATGNGPKIFRRRP